MDLEQILLAKAAQDAEQGPRLSDMTALGAGVGAALGTMSGGVAHTLARLGRKPPEGMAKLRPGMRFAGGLAGAVLGGVLGASAQRAMTNEPSGAGRLLAKMQAQGGLNEMDKLQLESILAETYSKQGLL